MGRRGPKPNRAERRRKDKEKAAKAKAQPPAPSAVAVQPNVNQMNSQTGNRNPNGTNNKERHPKLKVAEVFFGGMIAIFAFVQCLVSYWQFNAMQSQNDIAKGQLESMARQSEQTESMLEQMRLDQRAWLSMDTLTLNKFEVGKPPRFTFRVNNSGKTPAKIIAGRAGSFLASSDRQLARELAKFDEWADEGTKKGYVIPSDVVFALTVENGPVMTEKLIERIESWEETLYIGIRYKYTDSTGKEHTTQKCFYYEPREKNVGTLPLHDHMD